jgi:hypothetical protein
MPFRRAEDHVDGPPILGSEEAHSKVKEGIYALLELPGSLIILPISPENGDLHQHFSVSTEGTRLVIREAP